LAGGPEYPSWDDYAIFHARENGYEDRADIVELIGDNVESIRSRKAVEGLQSGGMKECRKCDGVKPMAAFADSSLISGYGRFCNDCKGITSDQGQGNANQVLSPITGVILLIRQLSKLVKPRTTSPDLEGDGKGSHSILDHLLNREVNGQKPYPRHKDDHGLGVLSSFGNDGQATYERLVFLALFGIAYLVLVGVVTVSFYLDVFFGDGVHWFVNDGPVEPVDSMYFLPGAMWFSLPGLCLLWLVVVTGVALNSVAGFWSIKKWIGMGSIPFVLFGICFIAPWLMGTATPFTTPTPGFERGVDLGEFKRSGYSECPNCNLLGANLSSADLIGADLRGARLAEADLFWSNLSDADLTNANLDGVDLHGANLTGANLDGADLTNANLDGVDLHGANLTGANLTGANLTGANLTNANLTNAILDDVIGADFTGAFHIPEKYLKN
jgi:hypothetical protein